MINSMQRVAHVVTLVILVSGRAHAEPDRAQTRAAMEHYFDGEKTGGWILVGMGAVGLASGGALLYRGDSELTKGFSYPLLGMGIVHLAAGIFVNVSSGRRIDSFADEIDADPSAWIARERPRMRGVSTQFTVLKIVEVALIAGGVTTGVLAHRAERKQLEGIGYGIALEAALTLGFDIVAARRAIRYRDDLAALDVATALAPGDAPRFVLTHSVAF
jgi:hypothetical protein